MHINSFKGRQKRRWSPRLYKMFEKQLQSRKLMEVERVNSCLIQSFGLSFGVFDFYIITKTQLMPKRINLAVNKLVNRPAKTSKQPIDKPPQSRPLTFQQLLSLAQRNTSHAQSTYQHHSLPVSYPSSQHQSQYGRSGVNTPQNSSRAWARRKEREDKLNHSLEDKVNSLEKKEKRNRSYSSQKYRVVQAWDLEKTNKMSPKESPKESSKESQSSKRSSTNRETNSLTSESKTFTQQFTSLLSMLDHSAHSHMRQTECFLSIEQIFTLMKQLHYLRKIQDEKYLVRIWRELEGDTYGGVPSQNLYEFLTFINHYNPLNLYPKHPTDPTSKKLAIDSNLKIRATQQSKLAIYEQYLALRVNRILYGNGEGDYQSSQKKLRRTSNIKIVDEDVSAQSRKERNSNEGKRPSFGKKERASQGQVVSAYGRRSVRLKSANPPHKPKKQQIIEKDKNQETVCYSQISQTKQSLKNLTSNQSEHSLNNISNEEPLPQRKPILSIDVNLGEGLCEKLLVFEGETALEVSRRLVEKYNIDQSLRVKFQTMLNGHIKNLLWRIEEVSEELISDRQQ